MIHICLYSFTFLFLKSILERQTVIETETYICFSNVYAFIGWFPNVPWKGIEPATLTYQESTLTNWATQPGSGFIFNSQKLEITQCACTKWMDKLIAYIFEGNIFKDNISLEKKWWGTNTSLNTSSTIYAIELKAENPLLLPPYKFHEMQSQLLKWKVN